MDFLSQFDTRTTALLIAIAFFIQASVIGAQRYLVGEYRGVGTALLGNLSMAIGFSLALFRDVLPDWLTIVVANLLILASPNLYYIAVSKFTGQKHSNVLVISILSLTALTLFYFRYITDNIGARIICISLMGALAIALMVYKLWGARQAPYRMGIRLIAISFTIYGIFLIFRSVVTIITPPKELFTNSPVESAVYLLLFLLSFSWTIGFILMVSQRLQIDLTELATIDSLSRIPNRRAAETFLEKEFARTTRQQGEFSLLLVDLDNLKEINDTYGHTTGDIILRELAQSLQTHIRKQDLAGRWGGDEFMVLLTDTSMDDAIQLAERIRKYAATTLTGNAKKAITISIGIATSHGAESAAEIIKNADAALYAAKATKNAVSNVKMQPIGVLGYEAS